MKIFQFKYARMVYGSFLLVVGSVLFLIPMLPFGYIFVFMGGYLLADRIPFFRKWKRWLKKRDKKGRLENIETKISTFFGEQPEMEEDMQREPCNQMR